MQNFAEIYKLAAARKGGKNKIAAFLPPFLSNEELLKIPNDRFLSMMTKCQNQAGFSYRVIENKWPEIEEAFFNFDILKLATLSPEQWENYMKDRRVVRNWQNIKALIENVEFVRQISVKHGSFAKFFTSWPKDDQVGLMIYLKKHASRMGGNTGQRFLRNMGRDSFLLFKDVCIALQNAGLDISDPPSSQRQLKLIQNTFNIWHKETGLPYGHISKILAMSVDGRVIINK